MTKKVGKSSDGVVFLYFSLSFIPSLVRVRRPCRGLEKFFPPVLQRCYGCSFHAQEIVHTGHGMLGYFFFVFFSFGEKGACPK